MPLNNEVSIVNFGGTDNDIKDSYARSLIADEETTTTATHPYSKGDYFIWTDRQLYKAKTDISVGDTLVLNTNVEEAGDVTDEISKINEKFGDLETVTGNRLSFTTDSAQVAQDTVLTFEPIQSGSGDPSSSNVRPISGYNSADITVPRKNLFDGTYNVMALAGSVLSETLQYVTDGNTPRTAIVPVSEGTTYTVSLDNTADRLRIACSEYYPEKNGYYKNLYVDDSSKQATINVPSGYKYLILYVSASSTEPNMQVELGSTATTYEPYNPVTDISLKLGETVYGGTVNLKTGKMVVDRGFAHVASLSDTLNTNSTAIGLLNVIVADGVQLYNNDIISNRLTIDTVDTDGTHYWSTNESALDNPDNGFVQFIIENITSTTDMETYLNSNPVDIVYPLANPYTIQLPPQTVELLKGSNVVTTNATSMTMKYRKGEIAKLEDLTEVGEILNDVSDIAIRTEQAMAKNGAKNLLPFPYYESSKVENGITYTVNNDGTITVSGIASAYTTFHLRNIYTTEHFSNVIISGCPKNGSNSTYEIVVNEDGIWKDGDKGNGYKTVGAVGAISINIQSGTNLSTPITFKPMVTVAEQPNSDYEHYVPYAMTNKELTDNVNTLASKPLSLSGAYHTIKLPLDAGAFIATALGWSGYVGSWLIFVTSEHINNLHVVQLYGGSAVSGKLPTLSKGTGTVTIDWSTVFTGYPGTIGLDYQNITSLPVSK